jgi:hypothetical protein
MLAVEVLKCTGEETGGFSTHESSLGIKIRPNAVSLTLGSSSGLAGLRIPEFTVSLPYGNVSREELLG